MRQTRRQRVLLSWLFAISATGCFPETREPLTRRWESEHFVYLSRPEDDSVTKAVMTVIEQHLSLFQSVMEQGASKNKFEYRKYLSRADFEANARYCSDDSVACQSGNTIESPFVLDGHELVHVYASVLGLPPTQMREGLALAFDCTHAYSTWSALSAGLPDVTATLLHGASAVVAQFFVWLIENRAPESFWKWYGAVDGASSLEDVEIAFSDAYGENLDDTWKVALSSAQRNHCIPLLECESSVLTDRSVLKSGSDGRPAAVLLPASEPVFVTVESGQTVDIVSCESDTPLLAGAAASALAVGERSLWNAAGHRFAVHLMTQGDDRTAEDTTLVTTLPSLWQTASCADEPVYVLGEWGDHVLLPPSGSRISVSVEPDEYSLGVRAEVGNVWLMAPGPSVSLCGPCDKNDAYSCTVVPSDATATEPWISGYYPSGGQAGQWLTIAYGAPNGLLLDLRVVD